MAMIVTLQNEVVRVNRLNEQLTEENKRLTELAQDNRSTLDVQSNESFDSITKQIHKESRDD